MVTLNQSSVFRQIHHVNNHVVLFSWNFPLITASYLLVNCTEFKINSLTFCCSSFISAHISHISEKQIENSLSPRLIYLPYREVKLFCQVGKWLPTNWGDSLSVLLNHLSQLFSHYLLRETDSIIKRKRWKSNKLSVCSEWKPEVFVYPLSVSQACILQLKLLTLQRWPASL